LPPTPGVLSLLQPARFRAKPTLAMKARDPRMGKENREIPDAILDLGLIPATLDELM